MDNKMTDEVNRRKYGLQKVDEYRNINKDMSILIPGQDLTNLGLNLNEQNTQIHNTFGSPFSEQPIRKTDATNYQIPPCYNKPTIQFQNIFLKNFTNETLFYIFYNMPEPDKQLMAVEELYKKGWKYHYDQETWFTDIKEISKKNQYSCKFWNIQKWCIQTIPQIEFDLEKDFCSIEEFKNSLDDDKQSNI